MRNLDRSLAPLALSIALLVSGCQAASQSRPESAVQAPVEVPQTLGAQAAAQSFYEVLLAEMLGQHGDFASGFELLIRAAVTREQAELFQRAVQMALQMGDGERALRAAHSWQETLPQSRDANKMALQLLLAMNRIPQTQWHLKQELRLMADDEVAENLYAIPLLYQRVSSKEMAFTVVQAALEAQLQESSPWRGDALATLGRMQLQAGQEKEAADYLEQAYRANPLASGMGFLALELSERGHARATDLARAYAAQAQAAPAFLLAYARAQIGQGQEVQALQTLSRVTDAKPDLPEAWLAKAALQAGQKDYARARASLDQFDVLLAALPESDLKQRGMDEAAVLRAQMADLEGRHSEAERWIAQVEDVELLMRAQLQRSRILAESGRMQQARLVIQSVPAPNAELQRLKVLAEVQLLRDFQHYTDAYALMGMLIKTHPKDDGLLYEYALLAERAGKVKEMERALRSLLARTPDHAHALNALGYSLADRGVRLKEARQLIAKALELEPESPYIIDSMGWLEYRQGRSSKALELLEKAYGIEPDAEIAAHLGEVLWSLKRYDRAREIWREGLKRDPQNAVLQATVKRLDGVASSLLSPAKAHKQEP